MASNGETKSCPWCAETILAAAKKCKHCGEFLTDERSSNEASNAVAPAAVASTPPKAATSKPSSPPRPSAEGSDGWTIGGWKWSDGKWCWLCIAHRRISCPDCPDRPAVVPEDNRKPIPIAPPAVARRTVAAPKQYTGRTAAAKAFNPLSDPTDGRKKFTSVSKSGACPRCGGTNFKAKRSVKGKVAAGLLAPKTQVKCTSCGLMFKRG